MFVLLQILFPLILSGLLNRIDIEANVVQSRGDMGNAGAIRYGISRGICHFVDADMKEKMKLGKRSFELSIASRLKAFRVRDYDSQTISRLCMTESRWSVCRVITSGEDPKNLGNLT